MLAFKTNDTELTIFVKGLTKRPDDLTQDDLQLLKSNGDTRVTEVSDKQAGKDKPVVTLQEPKP